MKVITISREYSAGGHSVAQKVAKELGIEIYDKDIIRNTAKESGIDEELIREEEEMLTKAQTFIRAITPIGYDDRYMIESYQRKVIEDIAKKGPCVILGRCADAILQDAGIDSLDVFIYADDIHRAARTAELIGTADPSAVKKTMLAKDKARHAYYTHFTGRRWGDCRNFNLCLDSGELGYDLCAELICKAAREE